MPATASEVFSQHTYIKHINMEPSQDFTSFLLGRPVIVKLNSGVDYRGKEDWMDSRDQTTQQTNRRIHIQGADGCKLTLSFRDN